MMTSAENMIRVGKLEQSYMKYHQKIHPTGRSIQPEDPSNQKIHPKCRGGKLNIGSFRLNRKQ